MNKKYYAVKKGRKVGIFQTWDECKEQTEGFSGSVYESFKTLEEAEEYLHSIEVITPINTDNTMSNVQIDKIIKDSDMSTVNVFVDGSRNNDITMYSYGVLIIHNSPEGTKKISLYKSMKDPEGLALHQFAGEMKAAMVGISWALDNNFKTVNVFYDYEGIEKFASGEYKKANNIISVNYVEFIKTITSKISLHFHKVKAHSGVLLNEEADALANRALHEKGFRTYKDGSFLVFGLGKADWISVVNDLKSRSLPSSISVEESIIKDKVDRLVISKGTEKISIQIYNKSKSYLQGIQSQLLEQLVQESITLLKNSEELYEHLNRYYALQIENEQIYTLAAYKVPNILFEKLEPKIKIVFECAMYNYLISSNMPEYTSLVTPVFRICEYYLHYILGHCLGNATTTSDGRNSFSFFDKVGGNYEYNGKHKSYSKNHIDTLNSLYNFYNKNRHVFSHWSSSDLLSNILTSQKEARDIMDESYVIFDKCHVLFYN